MQINLLDERISHIAKQVASTINSITSVEVAKLSAGIWSESWENYFFVWIIKFRIGFKVKLTTESRKIASFKLK